VLRREPAQARADHAEHVAVPAVPALVGHELRPRARARQLLHRGLREVERDEDLRRVQDVDRAAPGPASLPSRSRWNTDNGDQRAAHRGLGWTCWPVTAAG